MHQKILIDKIVDNIEKVIIGKRNEIYTILKGVLCNGHVLIEDIPGIGKTTLVKAMAKSLNLTCRRIQFTPDLLPSDITGISVYNQREMKFEFKMGPVFANIVLADEINRTSPKTQSALLEVMEENQISDGNTTYMLEKPFIVLATQNPIEYEGTYNLPEAQLDRFILRTSLGYPSIESEMKVLEIYRNNIPLNDISPVASKEDVMYLQKSSKNVLVNNDINRYIAEIGQATRNSPYIILGMSTRCVLDTLKIAQATALINGRTFVIPDDVKENIYSVISHRIVFKSFSSQGDNKREIIESIVNSVKVPKVM